MTGKMNVDVYDDVAEWGQMQMRAGMSSFSNIMRGHTPNRLEPQARQAAQVVRFASTLEPIT
jgi:hypothetical protein